MGTLQNSKQGHLLRSDLIIFSRNLGTGRQLRMMKFIEETRNLKGRVRILKTYFGKLITIKINQKKFTIK